MRGLIATAVDLGALAGVAGCGAEAPVAPPASGTAYRALDDEQRLAVAAGCQDRAAARAHGVAADQLGARRSAAAPRRARHRLSPDPRAAVPRSATCTERLPFVTPGLELRFDGAGRTAATRTPTKPSPTGRSRSAASSAGPHRDRHRPARVRVRQVLPRPHRARRALRPADAPPPEDRQQQLHPRLRRPPNAARKAYFSAICLDCLAGGPPPSVPVWAHAATSGVGSYPPRRSL